MFERVDRPPKERRREEEEEDGREKIACLTAIFCWKIAITIDDDTTSEERSALATHLDHRSMIANGPSRVESSQVDGDEEIVMTSVGVA